jgi:hypothetical protein
VGMRGRLATVGVVAVVALICAASAGAFTIYVDKLAAALKRSPVQTLDTSSNPLSAADAGRLATLVQRRDPGRIYIAVVPDLTSSQAGQLAQDLANMVNHAGVFIVIGGFNYHVTTTWQSGPAASSLLGRATGHKGDSLRVQLRKTIDAFAAADAKARHPGAAAATPPKPKGGGIKAPSAPRTTSTPVTTQPAPVSVVQSAPHKSSSSNVGLIVLLAALGLLVLAALIWGGLYMRTSMRSSHRRKEESADVHGSAQSDFIKLGEQIGALDIDSSMPGANADGKAAYAKAIECYQDAETRLKKPKDEYQFERAQDAIRQGLQHVDTANRLFNPSPEATAQSAGLGVAADSTTVSGAPAIAEVRGPQPAPATVPAPAPADGPAPAPEPAGGGDDLVSALAKLSSLHDRGVLTDAEFAEEKRKLIGE